MLQNNPSVAPHEGNELTLVMQGVKPAAIIEFKKQPEMYKKALELHYTLSVYHLTTGVISVTQKKNAKLHSIIALLGSSKASIVVRSKAEKQRMLGRILGYSDFEIDEFIKNPPECDCRWCMYE